MPRLAGRVRIPFNNNVIDIAQQIRLDDNKVYTYCMPASVRTYFVRTACVHRPKRSSYVRNLSGGVSIPFNYYTIFLKQRIHFSMRIGHTRTVCLLVHNVPLPAYCVRKMMPDTELSLELMCPTYLDV